MKLRQARKILNGNRKYFNSKGRWIYAPAIMVARKQTAARCIKRIGGLSKQGIKLSGFWKALMEAHRLSTESIYDLTA